MLENVRIVMVRPRGSGNIGSVARAMKNTGVHELAIIGKARTQGFLARAMAVHGRDILSNVLFYETLREAVADCRLVVGTTCRAGLYRAHSRSGLSNEDLKHCQLLINIPADPQYQSLNVAQAAIICLYEIYLASLAQVKKDNLSLARAEDVERLYDRMRSSLLKIGFLDSQNPEHMLFALRRILGRTRLEDRDVRILTGLFRQIEWYAEQGWKVVQEKEKQGIKIR
jgi:tRNA/rRNA methyltransferase